MKLPRTVAYALSVLFIKCTLLSLADNLNPNKFNLVLRIDVVVWGNLAQAAANTVTEGQAICITGNLNGESWQGADGTLRNKNVVRIVL